MNSLNLAIKAAYESKGNLTEVNKAYLEFLKTNFIIPIERNGDDNDNEEPKVLFFQENNNLFLPAFTNVAYLDYWAQPIKEQISLLKLTAVDLLKGIGENITLSLDIGSDFYKEFRPEEIARLKSIVSKFKHQDYKKEMN